MKDRTQCVYIGNDVSPPIHVSVTSGVPQGSDLGPLLFLIINDLPDNVVSPAGIKIFADDTKLYLAYVDNETSRLTHYTFENKTSSLKKNPDFVELLHIES